ncbi:MAG TPA: ferrous iron transport protein B [Thermoanaerobaculales bacterium]|nr:ferrous iron transport protein B [Thermoanaerobaculales bacterium]HQL29165.1 ferrous iron transport protein B [Thermoanaerobaculales bacterium]
MKFVLAGQPNSGKSTIFNAVAGYRSATANFPGSSVSYTVSRALIQGREVDVVDLPGVYSLTSSDTVAGEGESYLLDGGYDLIIDVVDASRLGRSLELTLQLLELQRPMIVALNMVDEAERRGISVDVSGLERELGVPVVATIARRGKGLRELFRTALRHAHVGGPAPARRLDREVEHALATVSSALQESGVKTGVPLRFAATKLIEDDRHFHGIVLGWYPGLEAAVAVAVSDLERAHGWSADQIVSGGRHAVAHSIEEQVSVHGSPSVGWREWLDRLLLGPWTGGLLMVAILTTLFWGVFGVGRRIEGPLVQLFEHVNAAVVGRLEPGSLLATVADGIVMGLAGGVAIVLPYLIPFLLGLAILEDTGYLPRLAYILDSLMHRIGLHGKSVLPLILGYGCSVPAIMSTRILESKRDRRITGALAAFIPCSARSVVIFGLVAAYLGPLWALLVYLLNLGVVVVLGNILGRRMRGSSPGLILEIPELSVPHPRTLAAKTWLTMREFITIAWPLLVASSVVLGLLEWFHAHDGINAMLSPLTVTVLGLPAAVGMTLVFGVLRKELTLVMLVQALGTTDVGSAMTVAQLMTFTLFVVFYVPCIATLAVMAREMGWRDTAWVAGLTTVVATAIAFAGRFAFAIAT